MGAFGKIAIASAAWMTLFPMEAFAVPKTCRSDVCAETRWDGRRVTIYFHKDSNPTDYTHWNFKGNNAQGITGAQIELRANVSSYSFNAFQGQSGKYFLQVCRRGRGATPSRCSRWADFVWEAK
jgi:hypothetical protein